MYLRVFSLALLTANTSFAYELTTHAFITQNAYQRSVLSPLSANSVWPMLGFARLDGISPFQVELPLDAVVACPPPPEFAFRGQGYFDNLSGNSDPTSCPRPITTLDQLEIGALVQQGLVPDSFPNAAHRVDGWLMIGAIREDDNCASLPQAITIYRTCASPRDEDPWGEIIRATKHFYDPIFDRQFEQPTACGLQACMRSTRWGLGVLNPFDAASAEDTQSLPGTGVVGRRNHFTYRDARNNYFLALAGQRTRSGRTFAENRRLNAEERAWRWATAIKSVGHVIHLLQDTAQPQHVRNDDHSPPIPARGASNDADAAYEAFTNYRLLRDRDQALALNLRQFGNPLRQIENEPLPLESVLPPLVVGNYPPVVFATPIRFFTTRREDGSDPVLARRGLADFSNRSFFSQGTLPGFRECNPPGQNTPPCNPDPTPTYVLPPNDITPANAYTVAPRGRLLAVGTQLVQLNEVTRAVSDTAVPGYADPFPSGQVPLITQGIWTETTDLLAAPMQLGTDYTLTYNNMVAQADVMIPRAIGYSTGFINYFFRGRLQVLPTVQGLLAVANQGVAHTVDADGYPRLSAAPNAIHGFEKLRMRVRNATPPIVEAGTGEVINQYIGDPDGNGPIKGELVAVVRYHRNLCYRPDYLGERREAYAAPPLVVGPITEPTCLANRKRSTYQEISVSQPLSIASAGLNSPSELDNLAVDSGVEKVFDFSADPIPVNASDVFVQIVYRGRMGTDLGSSGTPGSYEADGMAVGLHDAREPTFMGFWNNTDWFQSASGSQWLFTNTSFPRRDVTSFWVCAGAGADRRIAWRYFGTVKGGVAMAAPDNPGHVLLALLFGQRPGGVGQWAVRAVPDNAGAGDPPLIAASTAGAIRQANFEIISNSVLDAPLSNCSNVAPTAPAFWCVDPVKVRRSFPWGHIAKPVYVSANTINEPPDVDAPPALPFFSGLGAARVGGSIRWNEPTLGVCPDQTTSIEEDNAREREAELSEG